ncbi:MAG: argininosuccinate synthase [Calditrichia bacterium]
MHISATKRAFWKIQKCVRKKMCSAKVSCRWTRQTAKPLEIHLADGMPVAVIDHTNDITHDSPLEMFNYLNKIAGENAIGRVDLVENRFIGIKSRGILRNARRNGALGSSP